MLEIQKRKIMTNRCCSFCFSLLILTTFTSCDPPQNIVFENESEDISFVTIKLNLINNENFNLDRFAKADSIYLELKPNEKRNLHLGIGDWPDKEIIEISKIIKSIELKTQDYRKIYNTEKSIQKLFSENRSGFWFKTDVIIQIE